MQSLNTVYQALIKISGILFLLPHRERFWELRVICPITDRREDLNRFVSLIFHKNFCKLVIKNSHNS